MGRPTVYGKDDRSIHFQEKKSRENPLKRNLYQKNLVLTLQISTNKKTYNFLAKSSSSKSAHCFHIAWIPTGS